MTSCLSGIGSNILGIGSGVELSIDRCKEEDKMSKITVDQIAKLIQMSDQGIIRDEDLAEFLNNMKELACKNGMKYSVTINYQRTFSEMIEDGKYTWKNGKFNQKNFPIMGDGTVEVDLELVHLNKPASTKEVDAYLNENGLRPATLAELLAFGATYPDVQRNFPVIALGSSYLDNKDCRCVPYLDGEINDNRRRLNIRWQGRGWVDRVRFLAVKK